jgi:transcriptional regulator with XRE-family HTH domain
VAPESTASKIESALVLTHTLLPRKVTGMAREERVVRDLTPDQASELASMQEQGENDDDAPLREVSSPNRVVAYNLVRARKLRGLTQQQACDRLERYLGVRWSNVVFSAAERSASLDIERVRQFTADEIVAFARTFELPVAWFFLPPGGDADRARRTGIGGLPLVSTVRDAPAVDEDTLTPAELLELVVNTDLASLVKEMNDRIESYELGIESALVRRALMDHLEQWALATISDALVRDRHSLNTARSRVHRLAAQLDALADTDESEGTD